MDKHVPPGYSLRHPTFDDLDRVVELLVACDMAESGTSDFDAIELRNYWNAPGLDLSRDVWIIVAPNGQIVGYEEAHGGHEQRYNLDGYVHPDYAGLELGAQLLALGEARVREKAQASDTVHVQSNINAVNQRAHQLFQTAGYTLIRYFLRMQRQLDEQLPTPVWPAGITVRAFVLGQDDRATHAAIEEAFEDHWGHTYRPFEEWAQGRIERENFDPSLWSLAMDGDEVAGVALCYPRGDDGGWVQGLGVRRPWRRSGLGMALLLHAFNTFRERGKAWVGLGVDASSLTGATRLYERAGMHVTEQYATYEKTLAKE